MRQDVCRYKIFKHYIKGMFPYNDTENAWISGVKLTNTKVHYDSQSLIISVAVGLATALLSTLLPTLIYFSRLNLL